MKYFILILLSITSTYSLAQDQQKTWPQKNLEAAHVVNKAFATGDISEIDSVVAADFVDHSDRGDVGRDSLKTMIKMVHKQYPDMKSEIVKEMADDDYAFLLMRTTGTSNGEMGMPKGPYEMNAIEVLKFKNGKITEHWSYMELRDVMKMLPQQK
jgi:predicted SnoaL-like aldol condensation-catalyzing enzyme